MLRATYTSRPSYDYCPTHLSEILASALMMTPFVVPNRQSLHFPGPHTWSLTLQSILTEDVRYLLMPVRPLLMSNYVGQTIH
jgi:hypothetical protein